MALVIGHVFLAEDVRLHRPCAQKSCRQVANEVSARPRLMREAPQAIDDQRVTGPRKERSASRQWPRIGTFPPFARGQSAALGHRTSRLGRPGKGSLVTSLYGARTMAEAPRALAQQWEYSVIEAKDLVTGRPRLGVMGRNEWEAVGFVLGPKNHYLVLMKRPANLKAPGRKRR